MKRIFSIIVIAFCAACSTYEVEKPEVEKVPVLNALLKPGEQLEIFAGYSGELGAIYDTADVRQSRLYEAGELVDEFEYRGTYKIQKNHSYRIEVEYESGEEVSADCHTYGLLEMGEVKETRIDPPLVQNENFYSYRYQVPIQASGGAWEDVYLLFEPRQFDTIFMDSSNYRLNLNYWPGVKLPPEMEGKPHFKLPGNFNDTLEFISVLPGTVQMAEISPILYNAYREADEYEEGIGQTRTVSPTNVEGGTGIVSLFDLQR